MAKRSKITFHKDFKAPSTKERSDALGQFPFLNKATQSRERMLTNSTVGDVPPYRPSLHNRRNSHNSEVDGDDGSNNENCKTSGGNGNNDLRTVLTAALSDLNDRRLYVPTRGSVTSYSTPKPSDEMDWLAQIPEDGQTFEEYVSFLTTRSTGRIRPIANPDGEEILLLPIVRQQQRNNGFDAKGSTTEEENRKDVKENTELVEDEWPKAAPPLSKLVRYTEAFFDRRVRVLPAAKLHISLSQSLPSVANDTGKKTTKKTVVDGGEGGSGQKTRRKRKKRKIGDSMSTNHGVGTFASSTRKGQFQLSFPRNDKTYEPRVAVAGRSDARSQRIQLGVTSLLNELSDFRRNRYKEKEEDRKEKTAMKNSFCIMAITMEDLYDGPKDLFCAGMAFGGDKVAVFSFARYHPFLKMSPLHWHDYGYVGSCDGYSYYEDGVGAPAEMERDAPIVDRDVDQDDGGGNGYGVEFLRRSGKLLTHELGHLYGLDHCVHNRCLMMGTGHLVEDFRAPSHLCGVCLRKLQWRLGFDVRERYRLLANAFGELMGMMKEAKWCEKQFTYLEKK